MSTSISYWKRLRRTPYQTLAAICMIFITLFVMSVVLLMALGSSAILNHFEKIPQFSVYFKDEKDRASVDDLINRLNATGKVAKVEYISKDQALAFYKEQNKNDPILLEMVTADILPASIEISANSVRYLAELADMVKQESGIDEVVFQRDVAETLISWTAAIRKVGVLFTFFLILETIFVLLTIIGMKIALHKEEIEILRLVGATPWYIKKPFIKEGILYGVVGALTAWGVSALLILYLHPFVSSFLQGIPSLSLFSTSEFELLIWPATPALFVLLAVFLLVSGVIIGATGSFFAVSRYMKHTQA